MKIFYSERFCLILIVEIDYVTEHLKCQNLYDASWKWTYANHGTKEPLTPLIIIVLDFSDE